MLKILKGHQYLQILLLTIGLIVIPFSLHAQFDDLELTENPDEEKVSAKGYINLDKVQPGSQFQIAIVIEMAKGWHINANPPGEGLSPTVITLPQHPNITFGEIVYPIGDMIEIASIVGQASVYHDTVSVGIEATLDHNSPIEPINLDFKLDYQACSDDQCLLPQTIDILIPIDVVSNEEMIQRINEDIFADIAFTAQSDISNNEKNNEGGIKGALSGGNLWLAFLLAFVFGVGTSLTPCVYPLIPITVSIFGASESGKISKSFSLSVVYVLGIVITYSILGVIVALSTTGEVFGSAIADPRVIIPISIILVTLGLSMFGVFEIRLPSSLQNRLNSVGGAGFVGAFLMGLVAGFIAAPCTGPALAAILSYIAQIDSEDWIQKILLAFSLTSTYALGMGLLFICIGTFSGMISALPRSGGWMYILENIFGIAIITMALYFLKDLKIFEPITGLLQNSLPFFAIAGVLILFGLWLGKLTERFKGISSSMQLRKACGLILAIVGAFMIVGGLQQHSGGPQPNWVKDEPRALETARQENKLVMLDFYAIWCGACKELDHHTFSDQRVVDRLEDFVTVKLDFSDTKSDKTKTLTKKYSIRGLPVVIFMDAQGKIYERIEKFVKPEKMLEIIDEVESKAKTEKNGAL